MTLDQVRAIADAVLYEGCLLYPYRASSATNPSRWQYGVLGPPRASADSFAEDPSMAFQCLVTSNGHDPNGPAWLRLRLRFLHLQVRSVERVVGAGYVGVEELVVDGRSVLSWDEAVECELPLPALDVRPVLVGGGPERLRGHLEIPGAVEIEPLIDEAGTTVGRIVRRRWPLRADIAVSARLDAGFAQVTIGVHNACSREVHSRDDAIRASLIGTHALVVAEGAEFVSLLDPPPEAVAAAGRCTQHRCHSVLAGLPETSDVVLGSPIILNDHPEVAPPNPRTTIVSDVDGSGDVRLYREADRCERAPRNGDGARGRRRGSRRRGPRPARDGAGRRPGRPPHPRRAALPDVCRRLPAGGVGDRIGLTAEVAGAIPAAMKAVLALLRNCVPVPTESPVQEKSG